MAQLLRMSPRITTGRTTCLLCTMFAVACALVASASFAAPPAVTGRESAPDAAVDVQIDSRDPVDSASPSFPVGVTDTLSARVKHADRPPEYHDYIAAKEPMAWRVLRAKAGPSVVTIDQQGHITTLAPGVAQVELRYLGQVATTTLTVFDEPPSVLELSPPYATMELGSEQQFESKAQFGSWREWDRTDVVTWTATPVGSEAPVVAIDEHGKAHAIGVGIAEIAAELSGKRVSTQVIVVARSPLSAAANKQLMPPAVYRWCRARLQQVWLPKLRELAGAPIKLTGHATRRSADLSIHVEGTNATGIGIFWDPEKCEGSIAGWSGTFDWRTPSTPLEQMLAFAGYDCISPRLR
jgi:hypothetical protein